MFNRQFFVSKIYFVAYEKNIPSQIMKKNHHHHQPTIRSCFIWNVTRKFEKVSSFRLFNLWNMKIIHVSYILKSLVQFLPSKNGIAKTGWSIKKKFWSRAFLSLIKVQQVRFAWINFKTGLEIK